MLPGGIEVQDEKAPRRGDMESAFEGEWETGHRTLDVTGEAWCVLGGEVSRPQTMTTLGWPGAWDEGEGRTGQML